MANVRSDLMANILNRVKNSVSKKHGRLRVSSSLISVAAADADGTFYVVDRLGAFVRIHAILLANTAITVGTAYTLGVYVAGPWDAADQTAIDADILADTVDMSAERDQVATDANSFPLGGGTNAFAPGKWGAELWDMAGVAAAPTPGTQYDIVWTAVTVGTAAGTITTTILYTAGD